MLGFERIGAAWKALTGSKPATAAPRRHGISARYENALTTDENQRQWSQIDYLSAKSANNFHTRRQGRLRSRYETSNNPYLYGIVTSNADDLINTGPTLQVQLTKSKARQIEQAWALWAQAVDLVEKLRTCKLARTVDGEGFLLLKTVTDLDHPVKLYPLDIEADQVTTVAPLNMQELWVDGLILHPVTGKPTAYTVLKHHPGDYFFPGLNPLEVERIKAKYVLHWFPKFRPGQVRGMPLFITALDLFAELRAYRRAILTKAQIAANFTGVVETEGPADEDGGDTPTPWDTISLDRGTFTTTPAGGKFTLFPSGEPTTTYDQFQEKCLGEACRPLAYPLNLALGTSQKFNFSSAKLDHVNYRNALDVERAECNRIVLDKLFAAFIEEAALVPGLLPSEIRTAADVPHEWHWPGYAPLDPVVDADADHERLSNGTMTFQQFWASRGYDWRDVMEQQAQERQEIERLKLTFGEPKKQSETETVNDDGKKPASAGVNRVAALTTGGRHGV